MEIDLVDNHNTDDGDIESNLADFKGTKDDIFRDFIAEIMRTKVAHCIPDEGLDELLQATANACSKSNQLFKKKLRQAICTQSQRSELIKNCIRGHLYTT